MTVCPHCRAENAEGAPSCVDCAGSLAPDSASRPRRTEPPQEPDPIELRPFTRRRSDALFLSIVLLVAGAAFGGWQLLGASPPPQAPAPTASSVAESPKGLARQVAQLLVWGDDGQVPATLASYEARTGCQVGVWGAKTAASRESRQAERSSRKELISQFEPGTEWGRASVRITDPKAVVETDAGVERAVRLGVVAAVTCEKAKP